MAKLNAIGRKVLAFLLVMAMVLGMGSPALAASASTATQTVTIHFMERDSRDSKNVTESLIEELDIAINSTDSVMVAVQQAIKEAGTGYNCSYIYSPAYEWNGTQYPAYYYLDSVTLTNTEYKNNYTITETTTGHHYDGKAWVWNFDGSTTYPDSYMDQVSVGSNEDIYLYFEQTAFDY